MDRRPFAGRLRRSVDEPKRARPRLDPRAADAGQPQELDDLRSVAERVAVAVDGPLPPVPLAARASRVLRRGGADVRVMRHRAARDEPAAEVLDEEVVGRRAELLRDGHDGGVGPRRRAARARSAASVDSGSSASAPHASVVTTHGAPRSRQGQTCVP